MRNASERANKGDVAGITLVVEALTAPILLIHGGAGAYVKTTTAEQRLARGAKLEAVVRSGFAAFAQGGARAAVLAAMTELENDMSFNAGYGSRLQRDGAARLSASLMHGNATRLSAVYNAQQCRHPSALAAALQERSDRNLDGTGAAQLMRELGIAPTEVRSPAAIARWRRLAEKGDLVDREGAIGDADVDALEQARAARLPVPRDFDDDDNRHGTVGAVALDADGELWACTSTGGRGHEAVGRISDSPTPAGNYACPVVALSATGFGEQILDMNIGGRVATRMLDGASLEQALKRSFDEVLAAEGLFGVVAVGADGSAGYAHTTEACGIAWIDGSGHVHRDKHGRG